VSTMNRTLCLAAISLLASCSDRQSSSEVRPAKVVPTTTQHQGQEVTATDREFQRYSADVVAQKEKEEAAKKKSADNQKGDKKDESWVPAEFKVGMARWKDTGVYVDGQIRGFLTWGELPVALKPTWIRDKVSSNKRAGTNDPGWRWSQQRFYKFTDYMKAIGVDVKKVKVIHVYGPRFTQTIVATGKDLQTPPANGFMFRFGGNVSGKAIPQVPMGFGNGKTPDKITSVSIYVEKKPPELVPDVGLQLDGQTQLGVPYHGEPIRGGVRVYLDDRCAAIIKRQELDVKLATKTDAGELRWNLAQVLSAQGVDLKKVSELWVIRDDRRTESFPGTAIADLTFEAGSQAKGGVLLGDASVRANAIALHTTPIKRSELPYVIDDEQ
jgi:hypothetical protein